MIRVVLDVPATVGRCWKGVEHPKQWIKFLSSIPPPLTLHLFSRSADANVFPVLSDLQQNGQIEEEAALWFVDENGPVVRKTELRAGVTIVSVATWTMRNSALIAILTASAFY